MQGSYVLLAALGIFILIGGAKRVVLSLRLNQLSVVLIIIAIVAGNLFRPIGQNVIIYIGSSIMILLSLVFLITSRLRIMLRCLGSIVLITLLLFIYNVQIVERFSVGELSFNIMIIASVSIISFILSKNSGQAFVVAVLSVALYTILNAVIASELIVIGDNLMLEQMVYSGLLAILFSELVNEFSALFADRAPDMRFEAGEINDEDKRDLN